MFFNEFHKISAIECKFEPSKLTKPRDRYFVIITKITKNYKKVRFDLTELRLVRPITTGWTSTTFGAIRSATWSTDRGLLTATWWTCNCTTKRTSGQIIKMLVPCRLVSDHNIDPPGRPTVIIIFTLVVRSYGLYNKNNVGSYYQNCLSYGE